MKAYEFVLFGVAAMLFVFPRPAAAYLDPVTGSILWQVVIGGTLAAGMTARIYWRRLRLLFSRKPQAPDSHDTHESTHA